jgi:hypothetical protein
MVMKKLLILVLIFTSISCNKKEEIYYIPEAFKEWTVFKKGSYWIYYDSKNNRDDSSYVGRDPYQSIYRPENDSPYEVITFIQRYIGYFDVCGASMNNSLLSKKGGYGGILLSYYATAQISDSVFYSCRVLDRFDTLTLFGNTFHNVIHTGKPILDGAGYDSIGVMDYYFAKNIGVIMVSIKKNTIDSTLTLKRWHIVQ